jgi:hypothetical protein
MTEMTEKDWEYVPLPFVVVRSSMMALRIVDAACTGATGTEKSTW